MHTLKHKAEVFDCFVDWKASVEKQREKIENVLHW